MKSQRRLLGLFSVLLIIALACNVPVSSEAEPTETPPETATLPSAEPTEELSGPASIIHNQTPSVDFPQGTAGVDVESSGTGPEGRAPYGDSYDISLLERPFLQDMTYVPDLDIVAFSIAQDDVFYYVTIRLIGNNPNNPMGIHYAVELDLDRDGFGDFIVWASPPYSNNWTADNVQVFADLNRDTAGRSATKSDAPFSGDGYETLIHDVKQGIGDDADLAWVRITNENGAAVQFAFKRSLAGDTFIYGVIADGGLKDVALFDYVDRFTETEAGSPVRNKKNFPLKELHSVDNTCRQAVGFSATGFEPKICPVIVQPSAGGGSGGGGGATPSGAGCVGISPSDCTGSAPFFWAYPHCACSSTPFYESPP